MPSSHSFQLDPEFLQAAGPVLAAFSQLPKPAVHDVESRRQGFNAVLQQAGQMMPEHDVTVKTHKVKTRDGAEIDVIQVSPKQRKENGAAVLHIHGGGMISGSAQIYVDVGLVGVLSGESGVDFFSVDYRLAPEHNLDGIVNDSYDALQWLSTNAASLGVDNKRIGLFGDSAGGGIAAGVALQARDRQLSPPLRKQILIYPMLDDRNLVPDERIVPFALWTYESNVTGWSAVLGKGVAGTDQVPQFVRYAVPARVDDLSNLPDTYMDVGQLDIFLLEDLDFARRLHQAGVQVDLQVYKGLPHAWELVAPVDSTSTGKRIMAERIRAIQSI